jgi:hypothetical protein
VGALGHYLESEGIPTTGISLIREHTEVLRPPPLSLGRPLGVPRDAAFQRRVLERALGLLGSKSGPVLEDFPEDAPASAGGETEAFSCPVTFDPEPSDDRTALEQEIATLVPWHDLAVERRGHTAARLSGLGPAEAARFLTDFLADPQTASYRDDLDAGSALRLASEDLKTFYLESVHAQPAQPKGQAAAAEAGQWFWRETTAGRVLLRLRQVALDHPDRTVRAFGEKHLVPRAVLKAGEVSPPGRPGRTS